MARLVIIHGVCAGIGQSTLFEGLRALDLIPGADYLEEDSEESVRHPGYPAHFDRPEFREVADRFLRHNADRTAGVGHPTAEMLERFWRRLIEGALAAGRTLVSGLSFIDVAEDLDWAMESERALHDHARRVHEIAAPLDPVMIHLDGDIAVALDRAARQRGWNAERTPPVDEARQRAERIDRAFEAGGWAPHRIDGTSQRAGAVLETAVHLLQTERVLSRPAAR